MARRNMRSAVSASSTLVVENPFDRQMSVRLLKMQKRGWDLVDEPVSRWQTVEPGGRITFRTYRGTYCIELRTRKIQVPRLGLRTVIS